MNTGSIFRRLRSLGPRRVVDNVRLRLFYDVLLPASEHVGVHVLPVHYSSPIPSSQYLRRHVGEWYQEGSFLGIDFRLPEQQALLRRLAEFRSEYDALPLTRLYEQGLGLGYGDVEACMLYAMIRYLKPKRVIEVGSGSSTLVSLQALEKNRRCAGIRATLFAIEPEPHAALLRRTTESQAAVEVVHDYVQHVPVAFFTELDANDILFIDSSHVSRLGGDVDYLYLEILPRLKPGVVIHIHDIPFPFPARDVAWVTKRHQYYTEPALVQAFLSFNDAFAILACLSFLHHKMPEALHEAFGVYRQDGVSPTSLWIQRTR